MTGLGRRSRRCALRWGGEADEKYMAAVVVNVLSLRYDARSPLLGSPTHFMRAGSDLHDLTAVVIK